MSDIFSPPWHTVRDGDGTCEIQNAKGNALLMTVPSEIASEIVLAVNHWPRLLAAAQAVLYYPTNGLSVRVEAWHRLAEALRLAEGGGHDA